jgi:hypothetical protein
MFRTEKLSETGTVSFRNKFVKLVRLVRFIINIFIPSNVRTIN